MTYGSAIDALSEPDTGTSARRSTSRSPRAARAARSPRSPRRPGCAATISKPPSASAGALNPFRYDAPKGTRSLEGFLFPATYELNVGAPARDLVERQLAAFRENFARVDLARAQRKNLTGYDVLIIASMVEREAQLAKERPLIAAVIYNRLKRRHAARDRRDDALRAQQAQRRAAPVRAGDRLALQHPQARRSAADADRQPGLSSIRAAAAPANVQYRYFVVKPGTCGEHVFADDDRGARPQRRALRAAPARRPATSRRRRAERRRGRGGDAPRYGVLGWPVGHSRSPAMMRAAGLARYQRLPVAPDAFADTVRALHGAGFRGANVTIPHKQAALASRRAPARPRARSARRTR